MKSNKKKSGSSAKAKKQTSTDTHTENLTFHAIAKACTIEPTSKRMRMLRENTRLILEEFVNNGYILGFGVYKEGRAITGVWISV
jgi:hypothetical protein